MGLTREIYSKVLNGYLSYFGGSGVFAVKRPIKGQIRCQGYVIGVREDYALEFVFVVEKLGKSFGQSKQIFRFPDEKYLKNSVVYVNVMLVKLHKSAERGGIGYGTENVLLLDDRFSRLYFQLERLEILKI